MTNFAINHNLDKLSDSERKQYLSDLSVFVGLDPDLNAFDTLWMPDGYGKRNLVAYARRGTTELLREKHGISVVYCEDRSNAQEARFIVGGCNKWGRQEFAVGSAPTVGKTGEALSSAVMSASTRANRRLTLQFVGCGILDESEVIEVLENPASGARPVGAPIVFPAPQVAVNMALGKDITNVPALPATPVQITLQQPNSLEEFSAQQAALRAEATAHLNAPADAPKRTRKPRNQKSLDAPAQITIPQGTIDTNGVITPVSFKTDTVESPIKETPQVSAPVASAPVPSPAAPVAEAAAPLVQEKVAAPIVEAPAAPALDQEKFTEYRAKLAGIAKTLTQAGMMPSAGIGGVNAKLKKFAILQLGVNDVMTFSLEQWAELFEFFDQYTSDAAGLVAYINKAVGA